MTWEAGRYGGWRRFQRARPGVRGRLATALHAEGYRTGLVGKYLNYFGAHAPPGYVPAGMGQASQRS